MPGFVKTTIIIADDLRYRLKVQAAREKTDVSRLLSKLAEAYLAKQEGTLRTRTC